MREFGKLSPNFSPDFLAVGCADSDGGIPGLRVAIKVLGVAEGKVPSQFDMVNGGNVFRGEEVGQ